MVLHNTILYPEQIFLKSNEGTSYNNGTKKSNIIYELKYPISNLPSNIDAYIQINSFKFINAFYNINDNNNILYYSYNDNGDITNNILIVPVGNYNVNTLVNYLNEQLINKIVLTYDTMRFKLNFQTDSLYKQFSFIIGKNDIMEILGFSETTNFTNAITSENLINLSGTQSLYITLDNISISSNGSKNSNINNILECININVLSGSSQSYQNTMNTRYKIKDNQFNYLQIKIFDNNNKLVDFNNTDYYLNLSIIYVYKMQFIKDDSDLILNNDFAEINNDNKNNNDENNNI